MKRCSKCGLEKDLHEFGKNRTQKDGKQTYCKTCNKVRARTYYAAHRKRMRPQIYSSRKLRIKWMRARLSQVKREHGCTFCLEREPIALDFHHKHMNKEFTISQLRVSWAKLVTEIEKCLLVCANCHRKIHAKLIDDSTRSSDWSKTSLYSEIA